MQATETVFDYIQRHGTVPVLGGAVEPWRYQGWLLPYVIQIDDMLYGRWRYHLEICATGILPAAPIPRLAFGAPNRAVFKALDDWIRLVGYDNGGWSDFARWLDWMRWALGVSAEYPRLINEPNQKRLYQAVNIGPMLQAPCDYLGQWASEHTARGWNPNAFFPTPHGVVECMVQMMLANHVKGGTDMRLQSICDPCMGSGRMLLHSSNYSLNLYGQDIDPVACAMCSINAALYAPWLAFPLPAHVVPRATAAPPRWACDLF